jgi:hypothetical protein
MNTPKKPAASGTTEITPKARGAVTVGEPKRILVRGSFFQRYIGKLLALILKKEQ